MYYTFDIEIAKEYGVDEAIMIANLQFWILKNKACDKHFYDGHYWTYNSTKAFAELFPFWNQRHIQLVLNKLIEKGVLIKGNYNNSAYDRTLWYAFADDEKWIYNKEDFHLQKNVNGFVENCKAIPNNKPNNKPDNINNNINIIIGEQGPENDSGDKTNNLSLFPTDADIENRFFREWNVFCDKAKGNTCKCRCITAKRKRGLKKILQIAKTLQKQDGVNTDIIDYIFGEIIYPAWGSDPFLHGDVESKTHKEPYQFKIDHVLQEDFFVRMTEKLKK